MKEVRKGDREKRSLGEREDNRKNHLRKQNKTPHLSLCSVLKHSTDAAAGARHVRPVDATFQPIEVERDGVVEIFSDEVDGAAIEGHVADVVSIGEQEYRFLYCNRWHS